MRRGGLRLELGWQKLPGGGEDILGTWLLRRSVFCIVCFSQFPLLFRKLDYVTTCTHTNRLLDKIIH